MACSTRLRMTYSFLSKAAASGTESARPMNTCLNAGSPASAVGPNRESSTGTSRQPSTVWPSSSMMRSNTRRHSSAWSGSRGRNTRPAPYQSVSGRRMPASPHTRRKNRWGFWISIPTPSPVFTSQPQAPRCNRFFRMVRAFSTILWDLRPLMSTTKPTPQESCSVAGS